MILRRLLAIGEKQACANTNARGLKFLFSGAKAEEAVENVQNTDQIIEAVAEDIAQGENSIKKQLTFGNNKKRRIQKPLYQPLVNQFLNYPRQNIDEKQLKNKLSQAKSNEEIQKIFAETLEKLQSSKQLPLKKYENKLNLSTQLIMKKTFNQYQIDSKNTNNVFINSLEASSLQQATRFYEEGAFRRSNNPKILQIISEKVSERPSNSFYLNFLYEFMQNHENVIAKPVQNSGIQKFVENVVVNTYSNVNVLKFVWAYLKLNKKYETEHVQILLKELNKLKIDNLNVSESLKQLSYIFISRETSSKILKNIVRNSSSLQEVASNWITTLLILSRIQNYLLVGKKENKNVDIEDIMQFNKTTQNFKTFYKTDLSQILTESNYSEIADAYAFALKTKQNNLQNQVLGDLQNVCQINTSSKKQVKLTYDFPKDPIEFVTSLNNHFIQNPVMSNNPKFKLVESILKSQYNTALEYLVANVNLQNKGYSMVNYFLNQAESKGFRSKNSKALYALKEIFKESKSWLNQEEATFGKDRFQKTFFIYNSDKKFSQSSKPYKKRNQEYQQQTVQFDETIEDTENGEAELTGEKIEKKNNNAKPKGFFSKKNIASFSSTKPINDQTQIKSQEQSEAQYQKYLKAAKQVDSDVVSSQFSTNVKFNFSNCKTAQQLQQEFKKHVKEINAQNLPELLAKYNDVPLVGNLKTLFKFFFLNYTVGEESPSGLEVIFDSSFGSIQKDYGKYLEGCPFMFPLTDQLYIELLNEQNRRQKFKKIVAHIMLFKKSISDGIINLICQICEKQKIGLTLLQSINLINNRKISISYNSLKKIASSVQHFKNMQADLLQFLKKNCEISGIEMEAKLFEPYIANLVFTQNYEKLMMFLEILKVQFKAREYIVDKKLTAEQNIQKQKIHRAKQGQRISKQIFEILRVASISFKPRTNVPSFLVELLDSYLSKRTTDLSAIELGTALILYSQEQAKFLQILQKVKASKTENNQVVLNSLMKALMLFGRNLKIQVDKILRGTLFSKQFDLNEAQLLEFGYIFKDLDIPGPYSDYLEYLLKHQPKSTPEIKSLYYRILNMTTDDYAKTRLSGLLDFLFNPTREKERIQYKAAKIQEEKKAQILRQISISEQEIAQASRAAMSEVKGHEKIEIKQVADIIVQDSTEVKQKKQKKKAKKQQKKAKTTGGDNSDGKIEQKPQKQKKQQVVSNSQIFSPKCYMKNGKPIEEYWMQKQLGSLSYDQNKKIIYNDKIAPKDKRRQGVKMFISTFLARSMPEEADEKGGKLKGKGSDSKDGKKQSGKKEVSAKKK